MSRIEMGKKYRTRDGQPVELVTTSGRGMFPVVGYIGDSHDVEVWTDDGYMFCGEEDEDDLIEIVAPVTMWFNLYGDNISCMARGYRSKQEADQCADVKCRVACVQVTYTPGDGL